MITKKENKLRIIINSLFFPKKGIFFFFKIIGVIIIHGTLLKNIISRIGMLFTYFTPNDIKLKQKAPKTIIKIPEICLLFVMKLNIF